MQKQPPGGENRAPPGHRPLPMVEICEEWNSLSVKRHSRHVLPTPESPINSSRNSTSYCFAMAGTQGAPRLRAAAGSAPLSLCHRGPSQPQDAAVARRKRSGPRAGLARSLAHSLARGSAAAAGARRGEARAGGEVGGDSCGCRPCPALRPSPAPPLQRERGRGASGSPRPPGAGSQLCSQALGCPDPGRVCIFLPTI